MFSWSNRQSSTVMVSGWFGVCTIERDLPPNMREMGDLGDLTYSRSKLSTERKNRIGVLCSFALPLQSDRCLAESLPQVPLPSE
jgi:hypothetical protein